MVLVRCLGYEVRRDAASVLAKFIHEFTVFWRPFLDIDR